MLLKYYEIIIIRITSYTRMIAASRAFHETLMKEIYTALQQHQSDSSLDLSSIVQHWVLEVGTSEIHCNLSKVCKELQNAFSSIWCDYLEV